MNLQQSISRQLQAAKKEAVLEQDDTAKELRAWHQIVVRDWKHRPTFAVESGGGRSFRVKAINPVGKNRKIWFFVDRGTKPHLIRAKPGGRLKFQTGYSAKTAPVARANVGTGRRTGAWVSKQQVNHPGTKAREFSKTIVQSLDPPFVDRIQAAILRGINKGR